MRSRTLLHRLLFYIAKLGYRMLSLGRWEHRSDYVRMICRHYRSYLSYAASPHLAVSAHYSSAMVVHPACRGMLGATGRRCDEASNGTDHRHTVYHSMRRHARSPPRLRHGPGAWYLQFLWHCYIHMHNFVLHRGVSLWKPLIKFEPTQR